MEIWKQVVGYEGYYSVSNFGRIRREGKQHGATIGYISNHQICPVTGYDKKFLCKNGHRKPNNVHDIVANAFLGTKPVGFEVNHINGIRHDNRCENLEYVSKSQQQIHARRVLKKTNAIKLTKDDIINIRNQHKRGKLNNVQLGKLYNVSDGHICNIVNMKSWKYI